MTFVPLRTAAMAAILLVMPAAYAQTPPPSPVITNPNPATSPTTDENGNNPLARAGENSPTGQGPSMQTNPPTQGTVGSGPRNQAEEKSQRPATPPQPEH
jgi:hypothetical protein